YIFSPPFYYMVIVWQIVMIFKMSYSVFVLFTGIEPTQAPPFIPHLKAGSLLAGKDKLFVETKKI
ncbi:hypothetical protein, partial [Megasphaera elsdenii]|uniref:hypothetical protein n=1 Tax=Megasphaera elsdenii TaxID=907 RepID=UPI001D027855